jgi:hypothetical protein
MLLPVRAVHHYREPRNGDQLLPLRKPNALGSMMTKV